VLRINSARNLALLGVNSARNLLFGDAQADSSGRQKSSALGMTAVSLIMTWDSSTSTRHDVR